MQLFSHVTHSDSCLYLQGSLSSEVTSPPWIRVWVFTLSILKDGFNHFSRVPKQKICYTACWVGCYRLDTGKATACCKQYRYVTTLYCKRYKKIFLPDNYLYNTSCSDLRWWYPFKITLYIRCACMIIPKHLYFFFFSYKINTKLPPKQHSLLSFKNKVKSTSSKCFFNRLDPLVLKHTI